MVLYIIRKIQFSSRKSSVIVNIHRYFYFVQIVAMIYRYLFVIGYYNISGGNHIIQISDEYNIIGTRYESKATLESKFECINNICRGFSQSWLNITNFDLYDDVYDNLNQVLYQHNMSIVVNNIICLENQSIY